MKTGNCSDNVYIQSFDHDQAATSIVETILHEFPNASEFLIFFRDSTSPVLYVTPYCDISRDRVYKIRRYETNVSWINCFDITCKI